MLFFEKIFITCSLPEKQILSDAAESKRLRFLGAIIFKLIVSELLCQRYPYAREGWLTEARTILTRKKTIARFADKVGLMDYLLEQDSTIPNNLSNYGRTELLHTRFETLIGALYLDLGLEITKELIVSIVEPQIQKRAIDKQRYGLNLRGNLQALVHKRFGVEPKYRVLENKKEGYRGVFVIGVFINDKLLATGEGGTKKMLLPAPPLPRSKNLCKPKTTGNY